MSKLRQRHLCFDPPRQTQGEEVQAVRSDAYFDSLKKDAY